jgi:hypothetical protein
MPLPLIAALAPSIIGGIASLLGKGKGKEIPKESKATSASRSWFQNYLQQGLQRGNTPFMGTMPGVQPAFYNALDMINRYYTKGKKGYTKPQARGMGSILGLPTTGGAGGGFNPYAGGGGGGYGGGGYRGGMPGFGAMAGGMGGGFNPWANFAPRGMAFRPLESGVDVNQGAGWGQR